MFVGHLHSAWVRKGLPPWPATGDWIGVGPDLPTPTTGSVNFARAIDISGPTKNY